MATEQSTERRVGRLIRLGFIGIACGLVMGCSVYFIQTLLSLEGWQSRPALWDQAVHALDAVHFAKAFREFSPYQFFLQIHNSALWPPVIPLVQSVFLLFSDLDYGTVRLTVALFSALACLMVFVTGLKLHPRWGFATGLTAAALLFLSPGFQDYSLQAMLEVPGIALSLITVSLYYRFLDHETHTNWRYVVISATILFFAKFNYAIMVFLPILVTEIARQKVLREQLKASVFFVLRDIRWMSPFAIFVYAYIAFLVYVRMVGIRFEFAGQIVTIQRAFGNPLYFLILVMLGRLALFHRRTLQYYFKAIWWAPEQIRTVVRLFALPAVVWFVYPPFFSTFFIFLFSESTRKQSFFSSETLTFYPNAFMEYYMVAPIAGVLVLAGLAYLLFSWRRLDHKFRFLLGLILFNLLLVISHPNYQKRYLLTVIPYMFLAGSAGIYLNLDRLLRFAPRFSIWFNRAIGITAFAALVIGLFPSRAYLQQRFDQFTSNPSFTGFARQLCEHAYRSETNAIVGLSGYLNPAAIAMDCYDMHPDMQRSQLPTTMTRIGFHGYLDGQKVVESGRIGQFFVADYSEMAFDVGRQQEAYLLPGARASLPESSQYQKLDVIREAETGLQIDVYRRVSASHPKALQSEPSRKSQL
jgi:hypothetical protein